MDSPMIQTTRSQWADRVESILAAKEPPWTRAWLAKQIGMHRSQLSRLMNGQPTTEGGYYRLTDEIRTRIARALGVPAEMIFGELTEPTVPPNPENGAF